MKTSDVREKFLKFFAEKPRSHAVIPSASLVPENDPTTLFTGSGMQPLVPYLLGERHPKGRRVADSQKCFRAEDIDEVGDNRHTTFFEMLGNWSFGDYWKEEQLGWFFEFLTKEIGIKKGKLAASCFEGDPALGLPRDEESAAIWRKLGIPDGRIYFYGAEKNWWSRSGVPAQMPAGEPGGPDSEVFYDFGPSTSSGQIRHTAEFGDKCHPNCDCGRFMEIGNSVFMEYRKVLDPSTSSGPGGGKFENLPQRNVDFGGGLERITAAANDDPDVFKIDVFRQTIASIESHSVYRYDAGHPSLASGGILSSDEAKKSFRVVADHLRAAAFLSSDGVVPSNTGRGYVLRRLIRRAIRYADKLEFERGFIPEIAESFVRSYGSIYSEMNNKKADLLKELSQEEERFRSTLKNGLEELQKELVVSPKTISGTAAFKLFATYGFPVELTVEIASEKGAEVDLGGFNSEMSKHRNLSRTASAGAFKGGLADASEKTTRLHTAHHLLLKALQIVLGPDVKQRGSNITQERLRLDFSWGAKMTDEQKKEAERIVNEKIADNLPVVRNEMSRDEAEKLRAEHEFGQKYPDRVSVYSIGPKGAASDNPQFDKAFSIEFCGGPHVARTGEIGKFKIAKEEAVAAGIRRIRGILE